jgi:Ca2+-binding EF-hand superfamily protein
MKVTWLPALIAIATLATPALAQLDKKKAAQMLDSIERADTNKDGKTSYAEFKAARQAQFNRTKAKDGNLDLSAMTKSASERKQLLSELDGNDDGKISRAEFVNHKPKAWSRIDGNSDGALSKAEIKTIRARIMG